MANFTTDDIDAWFQCCMDHNTLAIRSYIARGFDVNTRTVIGISGLWLAVQDRHQDPRNAVSAVNALISGLEKQYADNPAKLLEALQAGPSGKTPEYLVRDGAERTIDFEMATGLRQAIEGAIENITKNRMVEQEVLHTQVSESRSSNPPPLKTDRTLTLARLQEKKPDGRTNLQIFAEQGQLVDVFTAVIWQGRQEEMDNAWQQVPAQHQNQVDIESIRAQIAAFTLRDRFKRDDDDLSQGF